MKYTLLIIFVFCVFNGVAQNSNADSLVFLASKAGNEYEKAKYNLELAKHFVKTDLVESQKYALKALQYKHNNDSLTIETYSRLGQIYYYMSKYDSALIYFNKEKVVLYKLKMNNKAAIVNISIGCIQLRKGNYDGAIKTLTESASWFEQAGDQLNAAKCYSNISSAMAELKMYPQAINYCKQALEIFEKDEKYSDFRLIAFSNLATHHLESSDTLKAISYYFEAEKLAAERGNNHSLAIIYSNLGSLFLNRDAAKAKYYIEKTIHLKNEMNMKDGIDNAIGNLGYLAMKRGDYHTAISYYKQAANLSGGKRLAYLYDKIKKCYVELNMLPAALEYSEKAQLVKDSMMNAENQKNFNEIHTRYETQKKENEILRLQTENLEKGRVEYLFYISIGVLLFVVIIFYLLFKNSVRNKIVAEQELKIKKQEFEKLLKSRELNEIDAIITAQEKERSRIAKNLHDNLGSKIAIIKMYAEEIDAEGRSIGEKGKLIEKLKLISEETYREVRKISHAENVGALIDKGLIPSVKNIAGHISQTNKLSINVININVTKLIKYNIEIQVFRIVQELLTNIMKHAEATEATIQFSEDNHVFSIVVEDDGKGFDTSYIANGMGLSNIEKRVNSILGEMVIDSAPGNGTTIILNIPL